MTYDLHKAVVVDVMSELDYHATPSLSVSGAKRLLPPSCPAVFKWERDNGGRPNKAVFDFGHAAHGLVLGVGQPLALIEADDWRTKAAKEQQAAAYAEGFVPLLRDDYLVVCDMASAIRRHPVASALLNPDVGVAERSIFWHDGKHGVDRRARIDWLRVTTDRVIAVDYKTARTANPASLGKTVADYRYHMQHAWYLDALRAAELSDDPSFVFIFQEKTAPYLVTVAELDVNAAWYGNDLNDRALSVYAECAATDTWPGYGDDIALVQLPAWATRETL